MDTATAEARGAKPLVPELARIALIRTTADVVNEVARLHRSGRAALFGFSGGPDFKNSTLTIVNVSQGGLGLPDREYYFRPDSATAAVRASYVQHLSRSLQLLGDAPARAHSAAPRIVALQAAIAPLHLTRVQRPDPNTNYHTMPLAAADSLTPHLEWRAVPLARWR